MRNRTLAGVALASLALAVTASAHPRRRLGRPDLSRPTPQIVNGVLDTLHPSTGALLDSGNFDLASLLCSGTLIGCQTFLTAGHCVQGNLNPAAYSVFLQHAGFFQVASIALNPDFNFPVGDVAVLRLSTPVDGIAPTPIDTTGVPAFGTPGTIVGFGRTGGPGNADYGLKRAGGVTMAACTPDISSTTSVCWNFLNPLGPPGSNSDTCNGDSGGPLLVDFGSGPTVAGVTSGGSSNNCLPTDSSYDANVFFYSAWIAAQGGADLGNTTCGSLPQVGSPGATVLAATGSLNVGTFEGRHTFQVPAGTTELRVSMNAIDDGPSDFDLYVKLGSPPTTADFDCRREGSNQYALCDFATPAAGTWYVLVNRFAGAGPYQVTATAFSVDCSKPANAGQPCDDGNACTATDVCQSGACAGAAVSNGTPCDDGHLCTPNDSCQAGVCTGGSLPATGCAQPVVAGRAPVLLKDTSPDNGDKLSWRWTPGATAKLAFGDPTSATDYAICIYDATVGTPHLVMEREVPAGSLWTEVTSGFRYRDHTAAHGGVRRIVLKEGVGGAARVTFDASGLNLAMMPLPLDQQGAVTVQLVNGNACWEARYSTNVKNQTDEFRAKAD